MRGLTARGYNIGTRLIEDFLARSNLPRCTDVREMAEVVSKVGFKMFLNITPAVSFQNVSSAASPSYTEASMPKSKVSTESAVAPETRAAPQEFTLQFVENPLAEFVALPEDALQGGLWYSNVLTGVLRGALEMVQIQAECTFVTDVLRGDETTEIRVKLIRFLDEGAPPVDD